MIITLGGENIAPILIESKIKSLCPIISNCFLLGEKKKFVTILVTLKVDMNPDLSPSENLTEEC